jgi:DNA-binding response OmpR family regulator
VERTKPRLLIVDEYPQTRETAPAVYGHYGYEIHVVSTPQDALAAMRAFRPDAVILEWFFRQGGVSGLATQLRAAAEPTRLVVIALSVFDEPADFQQRELVDAYFVKPTPADVIDRAIRARLGLLR